MNSIINTYRVSGVEKDSYYVINSDHKTYRAELKGKLRLDDSQWPAIGDWVFGSHQPGDWVLIEETLQRRNALQRKDPSHPRPQIFASNVDYMFVVTSANHDLNENRLERYVAMAIACNIEPVVVLNKIDLVESPEEIIARLKDRIDVEVLAVSATQNKNRSVFADYLQSEKTAVFVGSSGVGKSSIVNWLLEKEALGTAGIREDDDKGRHTTTRRSLHFLKTGGIVIDTPGIRSLSLVDGAEAVSELFSDIEEMAMTCKFRDCAHQEEPGCAIQEALDNGSIDSDRWQSYQKLRRENQIHTAKMNKKAARAEKKRVLERQKSYREAKRMKDRI